MQIATEQDARVAMVLHLFAIGAVTHLFAIQLVQRHSGDHRKRDALVRRPEHHIEIESEILFDSLCVVDTQTVQLIACNVGARIHEEGRLPSALQREFAELEHIALDHELNELFFVGFHQSSLRMLLRWLNRCFHLTSIF